MAVTIAPAHVAVREDAAVGAAIRRLIDDLPLGYYFDLIVHGARCVATAAPALIEGDRGFTGRGETIEEACARLAAAIDAERVGDHLHSWRTVDSGELCHDCGAAR